MSDIAEACAEYFAAHKKKTSSGQKAKPQTGGAKAGRKAGGKSSASASAAAAVADPGAKGSPLKRQRTDGTASDDGEEDNS